MGKVFIISIDKIDGCFIYFSKDFFDIEIVIVKFLEMNVFVFKDDGDFVSFFFLIIVW